VPIDVACILSLRSTLVSRLSVVFTIGENFLLELNFRKIYNPSRYPPDCLTENCAVCQFSFIGYIARQHAERAICYRPSLRLSVTSVDQLKTVELRVMQFSPYTSPIPLLFAKFRRYPGWRNEVILSVFWRFRQVAAQVRPSIAAEESKFKINRQVAAVAR